MKCQYGDMKSVECFNFSSDCDETIIGLPFLKKHSAVVDVLRKTIMLDGRVFYLVEIGRI